MHRLIRLFTMMLGFALPLSAVAGEVRDATFKSASLGRDLKVNIYVPDGKAPAGGWPVLYLLHGHNGNQNSWRDLGAIETTLNRMIAAGRIAPVVVVMPGAENSWYVDSNAAGGPGDFETALTQDLRLHVEAMLPVSKERTGRAIAGLSMGGFGALRLAYAHPDLYLAVASMSGAIWHNIPQAEMKKTPDELQLIQDNSYFHRVDPHTILAGIVLPSTGDHFSGSFGTPFDARLFNEKNVFTLASERIARGETLPATYLTSGDDDGYHLWRGAIALNDLLRAGGQTSKLRITAGDHVWSLWKMAIADALLFIDQQWQTKQIVAEQ